MGMVLSASAALYSYTGPAYAIPDDNPNGVTSTINVSTPQYNITDVTVTLDVTGGRNGDLYAYLSYNGTLVTLLNRVGTGSGGAIQQAFGFSTAGFNNVMLADGSANNIHNVASPISLPTTYTPDTGSLASFDGANPNGTWTLFFADLSGGGGTSTLQGWSLNITAVPEPVNVALVFFGGLLGIWSVLRPRRSTTIQT